MVKWKKLNKKVAGVLLGVMVLFSASTTAFAYVDPSAETTNTEAAQTETVQNEETEKPADKGILPENNKTEKKEDAFTEPGNGEVQDDIQNESSKEFLTITTKNNNTFYLVIDRSSTSQNVYLLSQVDENDLKEFVDQEKEPATVTPTPQAFYLCYKNSNYNIMYNITLPYTRPPGMQIMAVLPPGIDRPDPVHF